VLALESDDLVIRRVDWDGLDM